MQLYGESLLWQQSFPCMLHKALKELRLCLLHHRQIQTLVLAKGWMFDMAQRLIYHDKHAAGLELTEKEAAILVKVIQAQEGISREEIIDAIWEHHPDVQSTTFDTHLYRLRQKLESLPDNGLILDYEQGLYILLNS